tara:strand:+ start:11381 stop:12214 length:834 start_codon:yes stop_codon:yes gene_type:complete
MQSVKKRGKAALSQSAENALISSSQIIDCPKKLPSNLILHLKTKPQIEMDPVITDEIVDSVMSYNPSLTTPSAYDPCDNVSFIAEAKRTLKMETIQENETRNYKTEKSKLCWWCCHEYDQNLTVKMPLRKNEDTYECVGFFCSPECTCAYVLDSGSRYGDKWKELELLHEMVGARSSIRPAPKKELLDSFGGNIDIQTFRGDTKWHILYPPMVSLKLHMDDTPTSNEQSLVNFGNTPIHVNTLQVDDIQLEGIMDKKKRKNKKIPDNDTLDRFWGVE